MRTERFPLDQLGAKPIGAALSANDAAIAQAKGRLDSDDPDDSFQAVVDLVRYRARELQLRCIVRALRPRLRAAMVGIGLWSASEALAPLRELDVEKRADALSALLPHLSAEVVLSLVAATATHPWMMSADAFHIGAWLQGRRGGQSCLRDLVVRLLELGLLEPALKVVDRIQHVGARVEALVALKDNVGPEDWQALCERTLQRATTLGAEGTRESDQTADGALSVEDHLRAYYGKCSASRLFDRERARSVVHSALAELPAELRTDWTHRPGGLMIMFLAAPIIEALDRDGLRDELVAVASAEQPVAQHLVRQHERFANLTAEQRDKILSAHPKLRVPTRRDHGAAADRALSRAQRDREPEQLEGYVHSLADSNLARVFELLSATQTTSTPSYARAAVAFQVATRLRTAEATTLVTSIFDHHAGDIPFELRDTSAPWSWDDPLGLVSDENKRRAMIASVKRTRVDALPTVPFLQEALATDVALCHALSDAEVGFEEAYQEAFSDESSDRD